MVFDLPMKWHLSFTLRNFTAVKIYAVKCFKCFWLVFCIIKYDGYHNSKIHKYFSHVGICDVMWQCLGVYYNMRHGI